MQSDCRRIHPLTDSEFTFTIEHIAAAMRAEIGEPRRSMPVQIVHSHHDQKVFLQSAENIRDSWGICFDIDTQHPTSEQNGVTGGTQWVHRSYSGVGGEAVVETLFLEGVGHGWYGGNEGRFSFHNAPDVAHWNYTFFKRNPRDA